MGLRIFLMNNHVLDAEKTPFLSLRQELICHTLLVLIPFVLISILVMHFTDNHFIYTLDDPYIHLTLAKNIWHGFYGINIGEVSAPSSSILWPFLLSPFSIFGSYFEFVPLFINLLCLAGLVHLLLLIFKDIPIKSRVLLIFIILLSINGYGLVFTGMEHSLQIFLIVLGVYPLYKEKWCIQTSAPPNYQMIALVVLPMVRYEGLAISIPILCYLFYKGYRLKASIGLISILFILGLFSTFLYYQGLGLLPSSITAKYIPIVSNLKVNVRQYIYLLLVIVAIEIILWKKDPQLALVVFFTSMLHFLFGHFGGFGRYEAYFVLFIVILAVRLLIDLDLPIFPTVFALPVICYSLFLINFLIPLASANIFYQQVQMANIFRLLNDPVAVNDVGLISFRSHGKYALDLYGLGSTASQKSRIAQLNRASSDWISDLMSKENVKYAFIFDQWFPYKPSSWIKVGKLKVKVMRVVTTFATVTMYAVDPIHAQKLFAALKSYEPYINKDKVELIIYFGDEPGPVRPHLRKSELHSWTRY